MTRTIWQKAKIRMMKPALLSHLCEKSRLKETFHCGALWTHRQFRLSVKPG